mmetsp:Transcript_9280/g.9281  ORF Transcript_9280/g.9281 Transcript_9280/m.9281 type:complete len:629 (-) Transcript_9280:43-1929(-)
MMKWMKNFFQYLDRHHVNQNSLPNLTIRGLSIFYGEIVTQCKSKIISAFIHALELDRNGEHIDRDLLKNVTDIFMRVGTIHKPNDPADFYNFLESSVLESTRNFYEGKSRIWITEDSCPDYLLKVERCLIEEMSRADHCLHPSSGQKIRSVFLDVMINIHETTILEKETGIAYLLNHHKTDDMHRLYRLTSELTNGLQPIAQAVTKYIKEQGQGIIKQKLAKIAIDKKESPEDPEFVNAFMNAQEKFKSLISECFQNNSIFQRALNSAFEELVNQKIGKHGFSEILACYADRLLKKSSERLRDEVIEEELKKLLELFEHLADKDVFAEIYKNQLSKRLLNDTSASEDAEKSFISKMKMCCGASYTCKFEGMIMDLHLAQDLDQKFKESGSSLPIDFSVQVLTNSHWPYYKNHNVILPASLSDCIHVFNRYYALNTQHRVLTWTNCLGIVTLTGYFDQGQYDFICSTYQACVLYLFNDKSTHTYSEIKQIMNFDDDTCKGVMKTFVFSKNKILEKTGEERKINETDSFSIRGNFKTNQKKVKLPIPSKEENYSREKVSEDRNLAIEAAVVRIMKSRKTIAHSNLVAEVAGMLSVFKPQIKDIKSRIENLISRDYIERDNEDTNIYHYKA